MSITSGGQAATAELTVNARVAIDPAILEREAAKAVEQACSGRGLDCETRASRSLRPGRPVPVHRLVSVGDLIF